MCSKCYRDLRGNQQTTSSGAPKDVELQLPNSAQSSANSSAFATPAPTLPIGISSALGADARLSSSAPPFVVPSGATADSPKAARARHACASCNKNVGLLGFTCRCEKEFCAKHRDARDHNCTFDYKTFDRTKIAQSNPVVSSRKVPEI